MVPGPASSVLSVIYQALVPLASRGAQGVSGPSSSCVCALAWASLAQRFPASSVLAREGAGCGSVGDALPEEMDSSEGKPGPLYGQLALQIFGSASHSFK